MVNEKINFAKGKIDKNENCRFSFTKCSESITKSAKFKNEPTTPLPKPKRVITDSPPFFSLSKQPAWPKSSCSIWPNPSAQGRCGYLASNTANNSLTPFPQLFQPTQHPPLLEPLTPQQLTPHKTNQPISRTTNRNTSSKRRFIEHKKNYNSQIQSTPQTSHYPTQSPHSTHTTS